MGAEVHLPVGVLRMEREMIDVTSLGPRPDTQWRYTDQAGHQHHYTPTGYPTLTFVEDDRYWCEDCRDEHVEGHQECRECGERIRPGMTGPSTFREYEPGPVSYYLDDEPISPERYTELVAQYLTRP